MNRFPNSYTRGAALLNNLKRLAPGYQMRLTVEQLNEIEVPANPLDRQTPEFKAKWLYDRLPFVATYHADPLGRYFEISRPGRRDDDE